MRENNSRFIPQEVKEIGVFVIIGIMMAVVLPLVLGFGFQAFEESFVSGRPLQFGDILVTYQIYYIIIFAGIIGLPALKLIEMFTTKGNVDITRQKEPFPFSVAILHDPEKDGGLYNFFRYMGYKGLKNPMKWSLSMLRVFMIAILLFSAFGMLQTLSPKAQVVGIPQLPFQVAPATEVFFSAEPPAFSETTLMLFIFSILLGLNAYISSKFKLHPAIFWIVAFLVICPLIGLMWMGWHSIVYSGSETAMFATFLFGYIGSTITLLFGTWILWYVWHFFNNIFAKLTEIVPANEDIILVGVIIWILVFVMYLWAEVWLYRRKNRLRYVPTVQVAD